VFDALRAGASGFLLKDVTAERLFYAVRVVAAGEALLAPAVTRRLISEFVRLRPRPGTAPASALAALIPRETQLPRLVAEGLSQSRDSRPPARERRDREDARQPGAGQAQAAGLDAGGGHRL
jgi:DNA-binding NarL/FixJ family response regulator